MNSIIWLILSLLASTLATELTSDPMVTTLEDESRNGSTRLPDLASDIIYGNSSANRMSLIEEQLKLLNETGNEYLPEEVAIIMAFPVTNASHESIDSRSTLSFVNSTSYPMSFVDRVNEEGLNISSRSLDLNEFFRLLSPLNLLNLTSVLSTSVTTTTPKPPKADPYPDVPIVYAEQSPNYENDSKKPSVKPNIEIVYP